VEVELLRSNSEFEDTHVDIEQDDRIGKSPKPFMSFSIANLLVLTTIAAVSCIPILWFGIEGAIFSFLIFFVGFSYLLLRKKKFTIKEVGVVLGIFILILMLLPPPFAPIVTLDRAAKRAKCLNNIRQLVFACQKYQSGSLRFPPPFTTDPSGQPLHSWRVLILPYIEELALYDDLDLTKPWDHPDNLKHAHRMPSIFKCGEYEARANDRFANVMTSYNAVVGKETVWHPTEPRSFDDVRDGASNTIMIVESDAHRVHWMSPNDVRFDEIISMNPEGETNLLTSHHPGGSQLALVDGSAMFVASPVKVDDLKACLTIDGGEQVTIADW
jgi:hypothetical protein